MLRKPFAEVRPLRAEDIALGPNIGAGRRVTRPGRTIDFAEGDLDVGLLPSHPDRIRVVARCVRAEEMRLGPGHLLLLTEIGFQEMTGPREIVGQTKRAPVRAGSCKGRGSRNDQDAYPIEAKVINTPFPLT